MPNPNRPIEALIVYAHPESGSFTGAIKDRAVAALEGAGHRVTVSDLYAEAFNPVAGRHDFVGALDAARFHYQAEQQHAATHRRFAPDLVREQDRLARADLLIMLFPLWWGGAPAMIKGWFDRVCAYGFAYADGMRYDHGLFRGRRGLLGITTGGTIERFSRSGVYGEMSAVLYPMQHCMLEYLGLELMPPFVAYAAPRVDAAVREQYLRDWAQQLVEIASDATWRAGLPDDPRQALQDALCRAPGAGAWASRT